MARAAYAGRPFTHPNHSTGIANEASIGDVLALAGQAAPDRRGMIHCPSPAHFDEHPSAKVQPSGRGVRCHVCGWRGGVLDVAVALGIGADRASAARELEARLR